MRNHFYSASRPTPPQHRERLLAKYRASDLTQSQFAQQHGLKLSTLRQWIYRPGLPRVPRQTPRPVFQEVPLLGVPFLDNWAAELRLPGGTLLRLNAQASADWVGDLVERLS
jgi:hypothetical protein